ncbi:MAG: hypothetical protein ACMG57_02000 [Candidatus Dojkabacteria bacterium]
MDTILLIGITAGQSYYNIDIPQVTFTICIAVGGGVWAFDRNSDFAISILLISSVFLVRLFYAFIRGPEPPG